MLNNMTPISSLPPAVQDKVKKYQKEHGRMRYSEDSLESVFWRDTDEGYDFWYHVAYKGWDAAAAKFPTIAASFEQPTPPTWQPQRGEMVEVQDDGDKYWYVAEYIMHESRAIDPHIVLCNGVADSYRHVRRQSPITLSQIAEKFNIPEEQVRIEGFTRNQKEVSHD